MRIEVPDGSIYYWMYIQGLKHVPLANVLKACRSRGVEVRPKDQENYWNGWYNSDLYHGAGSTDVFQLTRSARVGMKPGNDFFESGYCDYPAHPYSGLPEIQRRWVPCDKRNKPMVKWGNGCMSLADAKAHRNQAYLAENLKGTKFIVIDCDGDHESKLDMQTISFLRRYAGSTHTLSKPKRVDEYDGYEHANCEWPASFHLTFAVDRLLPTMHFPYAHIDIIGNRCNSLRYWKNKEWNGLEPAPMTERVWNDLRKYISYRKEKANG